MRGPTDPAAAPAQADPQQRRRQALNSPSAWPAEAQGETSWFNGLAALGRNAAARLAKASRPLLERLARDVGGGSERQRANRRLDPAELARQVCRWAMDAGFVAVGVERVA